MQVKSINSIHNQNFRALNISREAGNFIREQAMNPKNKQNWRPIVDGLKAAKESLKTQKWGNVNVSLLKPSIINGNGTGYLVFSTALFAPALVGRSIENLCVEDIDFNSNDVIRDEVLGKSVKNGNALTKEWNSLSQAVDVAEKHEIYAANKESEVKIRKAEDDKYCTEMLDTLRTLGID